MAQVIGGLYPQSGGEPIDGAISVDPITLAAFLKLTGPVAVDGLDRAAHREERGPDPAA